MNNENNGKSRMWKDAPAALCEFAGVDPARKWAQCEKERDEWAALAGQYKQERDEARAGSRHNAARANTNADECNKAWKFLREATKQRDDALEELEVCVKERDEAREDAAHWKTEYEIVVDRLRGRKHPRDNGIIADDEIVPTLTRERDEARSQRNALAASLEYIASAGLTARQCEDEATKMLALVFEKEDGK